MLKRLLILALAVVWPAVGDAQTYGTVSTATSSAFGVVKPDNSTVTISGGVLSAPGGGVASVTSGSPGLSLSPTTGAVVGSLTQPNQYKSAPTSGSEYTAVAADAGYLTGITGSSITSLQVPQAGSTGFGSEAGFGYKNLTSATLSIAPYGTSTSVFYGAGGGTTYTLIPGGTIWITSDGTNWLTDAIANTPLTYSAQYIAGQNPNNAVLVADLPQPITILSIVGLPTAATGATATASVYEVPNTTACSGGTVLHSGSFNANGTAGTQQPLTLTTTIVPVGDSLCLQTSGTWTSGAGAITVQAIPGPAPGGGGSGIALTQKNNNFCNGPVASCAVTIPSTGTGHLLIVGVTYCANSGCTAATSAPTSVTDTLGNTCTAASQYVGPALPAAVAYVCPNNVGSGSDTITVNMPSSQYYISINASDWSGAATSSPYEATSSASGTGTSASITTGSSTTVSSDLIYSLLLYNNGPTVTPGQTQINVPSEEYQIAGAPGSYTNTWAATPSGNWVAVMMAIKP